MIVGLNRFGSQLWCVRSRLSPRLVSARQHTGPNLRAALSYWQIEVASGAPSEARPAVAHRGARKAAAVLHECERRLHDTRRYRWLVPWRPMQLEGRLLPGLIAVRAAGESSPSAGSGSTQGGGPGQVESGCQWHGAARPSSWMARILSSEPRSLGPSEQRPGGASFGVCYFLQSIV